MLLPGTSHLRLNSRILLGMFVQSTVLRPSLYFTDGESLRIDVKMSTDFLPFVFQPTVLT